MNHELRKFIDLTPFHLVLFERLEKLSAFVGKIKNVLLDQADSHIVLSTVRIYSTLLKSCGASITG